MVLANEEGAFKRGPFGSALKKSIFVEKGYKVYEQYCPSTTIALLRATTSRRRSLKNCARLK